MIYHKGGGSDDYNLDGLAEEVDEVVENLKPHLRKFDGIVVRGMSGIVTGVPVSLRLDKHLFIIRKDTDDCHAWTKLINAGKVKSETRWIFLDDFISEGHTRQVCIDKLKERDAKMVGQFLTQTMRLDWNDYTE